MAEVRLTRRQIIMHKSNVVGYFGEHAVVFEVGRDEDELVRPPAELQIGKEDWQDMGEPDKITVTIEPGDLLNDVA